MALTMSAMSMWIQLAVAACVLLMLGSLSTDARVVDSAADAELVIRRLYADQVKVVPSADDLTKVQIKSKEATCKCVDYNCGCCAHLYIPKIKLDNTCCVNVSYLPKEYGIAVVFTFDQYVVINITVSAKNPPPICFGIPYLEKEASICLHFYNLDFADKTLSGCIKLEARLLHVLIESVDFGCFHIPVPGITDQRNALEFVNALRVAERLRRIQ